MSPFCWPIIGLGIILLFAPFSKKVQEQLPRLALGAGSLTFILSWTVSFVIGDIVPYYEFWYQTDLPERDKLDFEGIGVYIQVPLAVILILSGLFFISIRWLFKRTSDRQKDSQRGILP
jgi:hypothetical protein